ncbi:anoctamin-10-like isoform X2 [Pomacea canaliculata]|uniref:anoctamin-10-like isoform X2 n=1 Tax=Pomacea canaliculata TaxID=400727 RepID=UPI000D72DDC4|nr:anoctamin-10-like isoform X2 [Pomacea canaliculata]
MEAQNIYHADKNHSDPAGLFEPLVVLEFSATAKRSSVEWLLAKLQALKTDGGADLAVRTLYIEHSSETMLLVTASTERLLLAAEMMEMKKKHKDGFHREVTVQDIENFDGSEDLGSFFTQAEKQRLIFKEIENIRAGELDQHVPGYENIKLYPGKSIIKKYLSRRILLQIYPVHDSEALKRLGDEWYQPHKAFSRQPIDKIQKYFGEKITLYFAFLGLYTVSLIPPAVIGVIYFVTSWRSVYREAIFAIFNLIWSTIFLETWKRYCVELTYSWGTINTAVSKFEEPRANFYGTLGRNPVTGKPEVVYPKWKRALRFYAVTVPVISLCLFVAFLVMLFYFWMQKWADSLHEEDKGWISFMLLFVPTAIYAVIIGILNSIYRIVAKKLNDFENHRLDSSYENHLVLKLILFDFVNCFICLFYVAFYLQDRAVLKSFLSTLLVTQQVIGQIREAMVPFLFLHRRSKQLDIALKKRQVLQENDEALDVDASVKKKVVVESSMDKYEGTMDDYLELFLQFGYVYLFSSAFPLAAVWAFLNNVTEIRCDAFKMCRIFQRPFSEPASSTGIWQIAFEVIGVISVLTNCALIGMDPEVQKLLPSDITAINMVLIFVGVEHIVLAIKMAISYFIPDVPRWVEVNLAKMEYETKQALLKERIATAARKKQMLRIFKRPARDTMQ